ncbi:hypothetical protein PROFUN_07117 [Planoprotostelium fungivorum]|uniref:Uncharacterized protein n=1 Tax=Planoprotostelium fungivorum TaxID=1890364 RepID=A0A2P6NMI3_9EUKA|nr:hypothetical protein PROFUN_07117 [Planoprotostelium fungivorum]
MNYATYPPGAMSHNTRTSNNNNTTMSSNNEKLGEFSSSYSYQSYSKTNDEAPIINGEHGSTQGFYDGQGKAHITQQSKTPFGNAQLESGARETIEGRRD